jgi:ATP-dependent Clp protease ATP-binding subunit ClpC
MFEHYTPIARRALVLAEEEARFLGQDFVGSEHILAGLARAGGRATAALEAVGVDAEDLRQQLQASARRDPVPVEGHLTADARQVLELARREADQLGHSSVGAEHVLLAVANLESSAGARALCSLGIVLAELRKEVLRAVTEGITETALLNEGASQPLLLDQHYGGYRSYPAGFWAGHRLRWRWRARRRRRSALGQEG